MGKRHRITVYFADDESYGSHFEGRQIKAMRPEEPILLESNQNHATIHTNGISTTLPASMGMGGYVPMITIKRVLGKAERGEEHNDKRRNTDT